MSGDPRGSVVVVGVGGLGAAAALELADGAVARLGLVDGDRVEVSNLHRQILHGPGDVGRPKAEVAAEKIEDAYPGLDVAVHVGRLGAGNAAAVLAGYDVAIDATDDPATKFLLNDACVAAGRILVHAGVTALRGQLFTIVPHETACLRCLFPEPPPEDEVATCSEAGILGPLAGMVGALEAREAILALGGAPVGDRLLTIDAGSFAMRVVPLRRSPRCPVCGSGAAVARKRACARAGVAVKENA